jgi:hypothetical protein
MRTAERSGKAPVEDQDHNFLPLETG